MEPDRSHVPLRYDVVPLPFDGVVHDVNAELVCVGHLVAVDGGIRAVRLSAAGTLELGTLGGAASSARGINDRGVIVGGSLTANDEAHHGFIWREGVMTDLNSLLTQDGWEVIHALGVNDGGEIAAVAHHDGRDHFVLLRPARHMDTGTPASSERTREM